jgi:hypothetical protein
MIVTCQQLMRRGEGPELRLSRLLAADPDAHTEGAPIAAARKEFEPQYARARLIGYQTMADEIIDISDDGSNDTYKDENGNVRTDHDGRDKHRR